MRARRLRFELATAEDDAELRRLLGATPMGGAIEVAFEREPDFFRGVGVAGPFHQVLVGRSGSRLAGLAIRAVREAWVNGEARPVGHLGDLRMLPQFRRGTALARGYRYLHELHGDGRCDLYTTVIVADNRTALETLAANRADLPRYSDLGLVHTPMIALRRPLTEPALDAGAEIVRGSAALLPEIVATLNRNRLQFAPAYRREDFEDGRFPGFRIEDFFVLLRGGSPTAVMSLWDQSSFRQAVVSRYNGLLGRLRPWINLVRRPRLPAPGERLRLTYAAFAATDEVDAFGFLLRRLHNEALRRGADYLTLALHERDPRRGALEDLPCTPFAGRLFCVTFDGPPALDRRVPFVEAALL